MLENNRKKLLFLALNFPDPTQSSTIYTDLMVALHHSKCDVFVVASSVETGKTGLFNEGGINVLRIQTSQQRNVGKIKKGINNVMLPFFYKRAIKKHFNSIEFDAVLLPTPPITLVHVINGLKKKKNIPVYLILRDIFPQNAVDLGMMKAHGLLHKYFRKLEKKLYHSADYIGCMSPGNIDYVKTHNPEVKDEKLHLLRNWQQAYKVENTEKEKIKESIGLQGKFVLFFGGNMSLPQRTENIVELAILYKHRSDVHFYIVGWGNHKTKFENKVKKLQLTNVTMAPFMPRNKYMSILNAADVGIVSLDPRFSIPNVPYKALSYFNSQIPMIALIDKNTDFGEWIQDEIKAGFWADAHQIESIVPKLDLLISNPTLRQQMGGNGYKYFMKELLPDKAASLILETLFGTNKNV